MDRDPFFSGKRSTFADLGTDATVDIAIWSQTEQGLGIAAGSLATLRPLLRLFLSKLGLTAGGGGLEMPPPGPPGAAPPSKHPSCLPRCSHGSGGRKGGPRELYSLSTITRHDETSFGRQSAAKELYERESDEHDDGEYRIQITPPRPARCASSPETRSVASQEQLQDVRSYV